MSSLLKNRKSARKSRRRRKAELTTLRDEIKALKQRNEELEKIVQQSKDKEASNISQYLPGLPGFL